MWPSLWVAFFFILPMMLRAVVGRQRLTSTTHTTEPAHPSPFHCQDPSSGRFELWASHPSDVAAHSPCSVAQVTVSVLVLRRGFLFQKFGGRSACHVLRMALSPCMKTACFPSHAEEECLPRVLFVSGAALCLIKTRHLCSLLALDHNAFQVGRGGGLISFLLLPSSSSLARMRGRVYLLFRVICVFSSGIASKFTEWSLCPEPSGKYFGKLDSTGIMAEEWAVGAVQDEVVEFGPFSQCLCIGICLGPTMPPSARLQESCTVQNTPGLCFLSMCALPCPGTCFLLPSQATGMSCFSPF